jgi:hypothetical protein
MAVRRLTSFAAAGLLLAAFLFSGLAVSPARAAGAIARGGGSVGISYNLRTRAEADRKALRECGHRQCRVIFHFERKCAAYAEGINRPYGYAAAPDQRTADRRALSYCRRYHGKDCQVRLKGCDRHEVR